jgi:hypothetical protein
MNRPPVRGVGGPSAVVASHEASALEVVRIEPQAEWDLRNRQPTSAPLARLVIATHLLSVDLGASPAAAFRGGLFGLGTFLALVSFSRRPGRCRRCVSVNERAEINFMKQLGMILLMGCTLSGGVANAATYYASKSGSNSYSCAQAQSTSTPRQSVNAGIGCLAAGDTLLVRGGSYDEGISSVPSGTSWSNKVRIANYPGEVVWLKPLSAASSAGGINIVIWLDGNYHYIEFDGINLDSTSIAGGYDLWVSTNNLNDPHHIRFQNAEIIAGLSGGGASVVLGSHNLMGQTGYNEIINATIHGGGKPGFCGWQCNNYGIYLQGPNNLIDHCDIYDTSSAGIHAYNANGDSPDNNIIRNNRIHDITRAGTLDEVWGIIVVGSNNQVYNNTVYGINIGNVNEGLGGISVARSGNKVWNNTIYNIKNSGISVDAQSSNTEIRNNIAYATTGAAFVNHGSGTVQSNNLFGVNPLFVNADSGDFNLTAGSPARNTGVTVALVASDAIGTVRPQEGTPDIGAFELKAFGAAPSAPTGLRISTDLQ